jgi:hypothetical protein
LGNRKRFKEELAPIMSAASERIHYAEGRRTNFSVIAAGLVAGGIAMLTFSLGNIELAVIRYPVLAAASWLFLSGVAVIVVYSLQTNRYPFTAATKTWKWFYRNALPRQAVFDLPWWSYFRFGNEKARIKAEYDQQLPEFVASLDRLNDESISLQQDIEQLCVLHINEKYKNLQLTHLRKLTGAYSGHGRPPFRLMPDQDSG